jgi:hypothetical protein
MLRHDSQLKQRKFGPGAVRTSLRETLEAHTPPGETQKDFVHPHALKKLPKTEMK